MSQPVFGHPQEAALYAANVAAGHTLCEHCAGTGNEFVGMYRACPDCRGSGVSEYAKEPDAPAPVLMPDDTR